MRRTTGPEFSLSRGLLIQHQKARLGLHAAQLVEETGDCIFAAETTLFTPRNNGPTTSPPTNTTNCVVCALTSPFP